MVQPSLDVLTVAPKTGDDRFTHQGQDVGANLLGFWRWAYSDLMSNVMRGVLAEYIVGLALGCVDGGVRLEWDATDLCTSQGCRVEVKSSASLQSWSQTKLSPIKFDIEPKTGWHADTNTYATERKRQADVFVFCVLTHTDKATVDPTRPEPVGFLRSVDKPTERCGRRTEEHHAWQPAPTESCEGFVRGSAGPHHRGGNPGTNAAKLVVGDGLREWPRCGAGGGPAGRGTREMTPCLFDHARGAPRRRSRCRRGEPHRHPGS